MAYEHLGCQEPCICALSYRGQALGPISPAPSVTTMRFSAGGDSLEIPKPKGHEPKSNHLLATLPNTEGARWLPQLEQVEMTLGDVLYESGG